jgi:hypothetical protein
MALQASSARVLPPIRQPEQFPPGLRLAESPPAEPDDGRLRPLEVAECTMCGVTRPLGLLVPDGSAACADIHWYCKDVKSCTERWTTALPPQSARLSLEQLPLRSSVRDRRGYGRTAVGLARLCLNPGYDRDQIEDILHGRVRRAGLRQAHVSVTCTRRRAR